MITVNLIHAAQIGDECGHLNAILYVIRVL